MQEFSFNGARYKFDESGDIDLGYDVTLWRWNGEKFDVGDVVAKYHPASDNFTHTDAATQQHELKARPSLFCPHAGFKQHININSEQCVY